MHEGDERVPRVPAQIHNLAFSRFRQRNVREMSGEEPPRRGGGIELGDFVVGVEIDLQVGDKIVRVMGDQRVVMIMVGNRV